MTSPDTSRRSMLKGSAAAIAAAFGGPLAAMATRDAQACTPAGASVLGTSPYGALAPVNDLTTGLPLIQLPPGFTYKSYGWAGDVMADGAVTPAAHDGMGVVRTRRIGRSTELVLIRNHELSTSTTVSRVVGSSLPGITKYDVGTTGSNYQIGGNTALVWRDGNWIESYTLLGGIYRPCAGGATLWESWLSNEELRSNSVSTTGKKHGYIFEVPVNPLDVSGVPLVAMGRMAHEASAIDPDTGYWYLTEDQGNANTLYRFLPTNAQGGHRSLEAGGQLQGLKVKGVMNADLRFPTLCQEYEIEWVDIANPDLDGATLASVVGSVSASGPYLQAYAGGAAIFGATEGCWVASGVVYFTDKQVNSNPRRCGRVWQLDLASNTLRAIFVGDDVTVGNSPDNICISPRGGLLFCEDGSSSGLNAQGVTVTLPGQRLMALRKDGTTYPFAQQNYNFTAAQLAAAGKPNAPTGNHKSTEWAGSVFSPDGRVLFVNLYQGVTLAISGPWAKGTL